MAEQLPGNEQGALDAEYDLAELEGGKVLPGYKGLRARTLVTGVGDPCDTGDERVISHVVDQLHGTGIKYGDGV
jgi:hypothetical protein